MKKINKEYYEIVKDILESDEFQKRKTYPHHGNITVYEHSIRVSYLAYKVSKYFKSVDTRCVAIGALLHDFYDEPWQGKLPKKPFFKKHGFVHAKQALINSEKLYPSHLNDKIKDIIKKHMFPLNITPPKYKESWIVTICDKMISLEVLKKPAFFLALIIGIKKL